MFRQLIFTHLAFILQEGTNIPGSSMKALIYIEKQTACMCRLHRAKNRSSSWENIIHTQADAWIHLFVLHGYRALHTRRHTVVSMLSKEGDSARLQFFIEESCPIKNNFSENSPVPCSPLKKNNQILMYGTRYQRYYLTSMQKKIRTQLMPALSFSFLFSVVCLPA